MKELSLCPQEDFEEVLERYNKMVYRLAYTRTGNYHDANDVLQDVFLRYVKYGKCFADEEHRKAWLIRATINCCKTMISSSWNRHRSADELNTALAGKRDKSLESSDEKNTILSAVISLPQKYRTIVHLYYYEDLPIHKIAEITGVVEATVKTRLHRARTLLKDMLKGVEFDG
mgnify:CR=1 FL=1